MAMINLHGTQDAVVPYDGGEWYPSTSDVVNWWVEYNGAQQPRDDQVDRVVYN